MTCQYCEQFFQHYQCAISTHLECDCPKCQGYCECPEPCPKCGSTDLDEKFVSGTQWDGADVTVEMYRCRKCGEAWSE